MTSHDGDIWIASPQQIYQFSGGKVDEEHRAVRYDANSADQVDDPPAITALMEAPDGAIWSGAKDGTLARYAHYDWKVMASGGEPFKTPIRALVGYDDKLFIGGAGLWKWDNKTSKITKFSAFKTVNINAFQARTRADGAKELLMAADNGVWRLAEGGWELFLPLSGSDKRALALLDQGREGLLVGTADGILRFSPAGIVLERMLPGNEISALLKDSEGHIWAGTKGNGIKYSSGTDWYQGSLDEGFPGANVSFLQTDSQGNLIVGVFGKGLFRASLDQLKSYLSKFPDGSKAIDTQKPKVYSTACKAVSEEVREGASGQVSMYRLDGKDYAFFSGHQVCPLGAGYLTPDRKLYLLSGWNLTVASENSRQEIEIPKELPADQVKKLLYVDSKRNVWFGPTTTGPFVYHPNEQPNEKGTFESFTSTAELVNNPTSFILEDKNAVTWVGSAPPFDRDSQKFLAPSLHRYDGTEWKHFTPKEGLSSWMLQDAVLRKDGTIAIAGDNGLSFIRKDTIEKVRASDALRKRFMFSIFEDRLGDLWIGHQFFGIGLTYFDSSSFHSRTTEQGIFSDRIISVSQDALDRIWILASNGSVGIYPRSFFDKRFFDGEAPERPESEPETASRREAKNPEEPVLEDKKVAPPSAELVAPSENLSSRDLQVEVTGGDEEDE